MHFMLHKIAEDMTTKESKKKERERERNAVNEHTYTKHGGNGVPLLDIVIETYKLERPLPKMLFILPSNTK